MCDDHCSHLIEVKKYLYSVKTDRKIVFYLETHQVSVLLKICVFYFINTLMSARVLL